MTADELREAGFEPVCGEDEVGGPMPKRVSVDGRGVLVCRDADELYAVDEICPHENKSMRFGVVFDGSITCPHHQYRFKLVDGRTRRRCASLQTFQVELADGDVWVKL